MQCDCNLQATHRRAVEQGTASWQVKQVYLYLCPSCLAQEIAMNGADGIEEIATAPVRSRPPGRGEQIARFLHTQGVHAALARNPHLFERAGKRRGYQNSSPLSQRWTLK